MRIILPWKLTISIVCIPELLKNSPKTEKPTETEWVLLSMGLRFGTKLPELQGGFQSDGIQDWNQLRSDSIPLLFLSSTSLTHRHQYKFFGQVLSL